MRARIRSEHEQKWDFLDKLHIFKSAGPNEIQGIADQSDEFQFPERDWNK